LHAYEGQVMKMSDFENPAWRTAAISEIFISPYLSRESSELYCTAQPVLQVVLNVVSYACML